MSLWQIPQLFLLFNQCAETLVSYYLNIPGNASSSDELHSMRIWCRQTLCRKLIKLLIICFFSILLGRGRKSCLIWWINRRQHQNVQVVIKEKVLTLTSWQEYQTCDACFLENNSEVVNYKSWQVILWKCVCINVCSHQHKYQHKYNLCWHGWLKERGENCHILQGVRHAHNMRKLQQRQNIISCFVFLSWLNARTPGYTCP